MNTEQAPRVLAVPVAAAGQRLDNFLLRHLKGIPRSLVYRLVRKGAIRVNGRRVKVEHRVAEGDQIRVPALEAIGDTVGPVKVPDGILQGLRRAIIHEDAQYLILDKPAGLAVHGGSGLAYGIIDAMRLLRPAAGLELGHRLDRETSGCLVLTKTRAALQAFHEALRSGQVGKRYLALVAGAWAGGVRRCDLPIAQDREDGGKRHMRVDSGASGRPRTATSTFTPVEGFARFTLMAVDIGTGRTHQIRVHGQALGHPVVGDHEYGDAPANRQARSLGLKRMFLHAQSIAFPDANGEPLVFSAPLPSELQAVLARLSEDAA